MVKLLLDVGNSRCKCAEYVAAGGLHCHPPVAVAEADDAAACLPESVRGEVGAAAVASVRNGEFNRRLSEAIAARFKVQAGFVKTERTACGVTTVYRRAASLGVDRFLGLIGAWRRVGGACVVADCGTAVTVDGINANGVHQGGLIMPGLRLLQSSLYRGTDRLPSLGENKSEERGFGENGGPAEDVLFARETETAVASGCRRTFVAAVRAAMREMQASLGDDAVLLTTGGDGSLAAGDSEDVHYHPHLTLEGLAVFSESNCD